MPQQSVPSTFIEKLVFNFFKYFSKLKTFLQTLLRLELETGKLGLVLKKRKSAKLSMTTFASYSLSYLCSASSPHHAVKFAVLGYGRFKHVILTCMGILGEYNLPQTSSIGVVSFFSAPHPHPPEGGGIPYVTYNKNNVNNNNYIWHL
jgi:hypothetical protein